MHTLYRAARRTMSVDDDRTTAQSQGQNGHDSTFDPDDMPDMSEMQRLLDEQDAQFKSIKRGEVVEGQIARIDQDEILVEIGLKSEGVLSTKELPAQGYGSLSELHVGDDVLVYVMQPETPEGHAIVSIKRARLERQWRIAQDQYERGDLLEAEVIDHNKGGLIVNLEGIRGFVPISQILNLKREDTADNAETQAKLQSMVGRKLQLKIIEINRNRNRLILSERLAVQEWRAKRREELLNELQVGEVRKGVVSNLSNFGAFVDLGGADGLVHISQLAWSRVNHPSEVLKVGQEVEVQVLSVDKEKKKIALSIKRAEVDPWTTVEQRYQVGQLVTGTITKIAPFGAFARIEDGVEGLIHLSELPAGQQDPKAVLKEGQEVQVRILRIDAERRRLGLSIRQADENAPLEEPSAGHPAEDLVGEGGISAPGVQREASGTVSGETTPAPQPTTASAAQPARGKPADEEPPTAMASAFQAAALAAQQREQAAAQSEAVVDATSPEAEAVGSTPAEAAEEAVSASDTANAAVDSVPEEHPAPEEPEAITTAAPEEPEAVVAAPEEPDAVDSAPEEPEAVVAAPEEADSKPEPKAVVPPKPEPVAKTQSRSSKSAEKEVTGVDSQAAVADESTVATEAAISGEAEQSEA
jgi:small subunit ribosomal protein S1